MKGIDPLVATVLLIAFTVAVGGIISIWLTGFTQTQTAAVGSQASTSITCSNGGISLSSLGYCSSNGYLSGQISNTGTISLGNLSITIIYSNSTTTQKFCLNLTGTTVGALASPCTGNLTLAPSDLQTFNFTIGGSNYGTIRVTSNCSGVVYTCGLNQGCSVGATC